MKCLVVINVKIVTGDNHNRVSMPLTFAVEVQKALMEVVPITDKGVKAEQCNDSSVDLGNNRAELKAHLFLN